MWIQGWLSSEIATNLIVTTCFLHRNGSHIFDFTDYVSSLFHLVFWKLIRLLISTTMNKSFDNHFYVLEKKMSYFLNIVMGWREGNRLESQHFHCILPNFALHLSWETIVFGSSFQRYWRKMSANAQLLVCFSHFPPIFHPASNPLIHFYHFFSSNN